VLIASWYRERPTVGIWLYSSRNSTDFRGIPVLPTYHSAYLLRSPEQKAKAWQDLKKIIIALAEGPPRPTTLF